MYTSELLERFSGDGHGTVMKFLVLERCHFESPFRLKIYEWSMGIKVLKVNAFDVVLTL